MGCLNIGFYPQESNAEGDQAQQYPADKAEVKQEEFHLVAFHHLLAAAQAFADGQGRLVVGDVGSEGVGIALHYTGNNEQKRPKEGKDVYQNGGSEVSAVVFEDHERLGDEVVVSCLAPHKQQECKAESEYEGAENQQAAQGDCACDGGQCEEEYRTEYGIKPVAFEQLGGGIANLSVGGHSARIDGGVFFHKMCVFWNAKIHIFSDMDKKT